VATAEYHQLQAKTLLELAQQSTDISTATALREMAADHMELARGADGNGKPRADRQ
jgi:hypothetical protein